MALICLGLACVATLSAQDTAFLLKGASLVLPDNWSRSYDPPEVLIRVKVLPDSSLALVEVLDGKKELIPFLADHLSIHKYPLADSLGISQEFDALLGIEQLFDPGAQAVPAEDILPEIEAWIARSREDLNHRHPEHDPSLLNGLNSLPEAYRAGYFSYRRPDEFAPLSINGFQPHASAFSRPVLEDGARSIYHRQDSALGIAYADQVYPYHVTLSDIEVGIGDYEQLTARGAVKKNQLLGVDGLYLGLDFLVQSGYWLQQDSGRNAVKLFLSAPLGRTRLELAFADQISDLSMLDLRPEYWQTQNFPVERRYRTVYAAWKSPWVNLGLFNENKTSRSPLFHQTLHNDALQLKVWQSFLLGGLELAPSFTRLFAQRNFSLANQDPENVAGLGFRSSLPLLGGEVQADLVDLELPRISGDLFHAWEKFDLGGVFRFTSHPSVAQLSTEDIYLEGSSLPRVEVRENSNLGAYLRHRFNQSSSAVLTLGHKNLNYPGALVIPTTGEKASLSGARDFIYLKLGGNLSQRMNEWQLDWTPSVSWRGEAELYEEPVFQYQSHINLTRLLPYGNALFAGFSLTGHSAYLSSDPRFYEVETSAIADIWAGVLITNRFELTVFYKNLADTSIYGVYPLPATLQASLRWFFLN
ncbi:MAG: hypothetical protein K0B87_06265 [Candidatus Syntrophosphaera sp.]|nr:hypothetical protein [Candidatus Syntrophosphaera sp.]